MGKLAIYKYLSFMVLVITVLVAVFTIFGLFGGNANPANNTAMALLVYILPLLIIADAILLIFWLIRKRWHWAVIPCITLLMCIPYIGTIWQPGIFRSTDESKSGLKVATYNVAAFGRVASGFQALAILDEMRNHQVDVLCMQEYLEENADTIGNSSHYLEYFSEWTRGKSDMAIFSRFHILESQTIDFGPGTNNSAMWADIDVRGKVLRVFNVHLETTGINRALHKAAKEETNAVTAKTESNRLLRSIYGSYTQGMIKRAVQADLMEKEIAKSPYPVILCGDFNDVPYSFVYKKMKGDLVDGFKEAGTGFMYTFRGRKKVRIDYIFHSEELEGEHYYKEDVSYSDHLPVFMKIAL